MRITGAYAPVLVDPRKLAFDQVGQGQFVEENVEELVACQRKDEVVEAFALVAGLSGTRAARATLRAVYLIAAAEAVVARIDGFPATAAAVAKLRFLYVLARNTDLFTVVQVLHSALADGVGHRLANLPLESFDEARAIDRTFVFAVEAAVYDTNRHEVLSKLASVRTTCARADTTRTKGEPAFRYNPW